MTRRVIGIIAISGCACALIALALLWLVVIPRIDSGGLALFDMRPRGYSFDEARDLLIALGAQGRHAYRWIEVPLDMLLVAGYGAGLGCAIIWLQGPKQAGARRFGGRRKPSGGRVAGALRSILLGAPFLAAAFDLWENVLIFRILGQGEDPSFRLVAEASRTTTYKMVFLGITALALVVSLARYLRRRRES